MVIFKDKGFKKKTTVFIIIELLLLMSIIVISLIDRSHARFYDASEFHTQLGTYESNFVSIQDESTPMTLLSQGVFSNLNPGIYRVNVVYDAVSVDNELPGWILVSFLNEDRNFFSADLKDGDGRVAKVRAFVYDEYVDDSLEIRVVYSGNGLLSVKQFEIWRKNDLINLLTFLMAVSAVLWMVTLLIFPYQSDKKDLRFYGEIILLYAFAFSFLSSFYVGLLVVGMILLAISGLLNRKNNISKKKLVAEEWALIGFFGIAVLGSLFAKYDVSTAFGSAFVFVIYFLIFFSSRNYLTKEFMSKLFCVLSVSIIVTGLVSLYHYYVYQWAWAISWQNSFYLIISKSLGNIASLFEEWPTRGGYKLAIYITLLSGYLVNTWKTTDWKKKSLMIAAMAVGLYCMGLTHSRGAFAFLMAALSVFALFKLKIKKAILIIVPAVVILGGIVAFTANEKIRMTFTAPLEEPNIQRRLFQTEVAFELFKDNQKFTGIGLMNFKPSFVEYEDNPLYENTDFIHNIYLSTLVETGVLGFLALGAFFVLLTVKSFKSRKEYFPLLALSLLAGFYISGFLTSMMIYGVPVSVTLWMFWGLSRNENLLEEK